MDKTGSKEWGKITTDEHTPFTFPLTIFSTESITTLILKGCGLDQQHTDTTRLPPCIFDRSHCILTQQQLDAMRLHTMKMLIGCRLEQQHSHPMRLHSLKTPTLVRVL